MSDDLLARIRDYADELTEPHAHRERYEIWTPGRHRKILHHPTVQHGLLTQLHQAVLTSQTSTDDTGRAIPASRPPLEVEALSRYEQISAAARTWTVGLDLKRRYNPASNIRSINAAAGRLDQPEQKQLCADLRRWTSWCRVYLGLERIHTARGVRCLVPDCATLGSLRINLTTSHAVCAACGATWDTETIGVLANHIKTSRRAA